MDPFGCRRQDGDALCDLHGSILNAELTKGYVREETIGVMNLEMASLSPAAKRCDAIVRFHSLSCARVSFLPFPL